MANSGSRDIFALLVNPRDGRPYCAVGSIDAGAVTLVNVDGQRVGGGYLDTEASSKYVSSAVATGLPRAHTPDGVTGKGGGLGTLLYTGLCARAHLGAIDALDLPKWMAGYGGDGISSETSTRTAQADAWWLRARERFGLAEVVTGCDHSDFDGEVAVSERAAKAALSIKFGVDPKVIELDGNDLAVKASGYYEQCGVEFDAYPYRHARDAHLVVALVKSDYEEPKLNGITPDSLIEVDTQALAALNVASLRVTFKDKRSAWSNFNWLVEVAEAAKVPAREIDRMKLRFVTGVDNDDRSWSEIMDPRGYIEERENPSAPWLTAYNGHNGRDGHRTWVRASGRRRLTPRRAMPVRPTRLAPALRSNPGAGASDAQAAQAVEHLAALRESLGWSVFQGDEDETRTAPRKNGRGGRTMRGRAR